jgi:hypothetical protein
MSERKYQRRDEKLEANGISRKEWVAQAIALAGMQGTGARRPAGKRTKPLDEAPETDDYDDEEDKESEAD